MNQWWVLLTGTLGTFSGTSSEIHTFHSRKCIWNVCQMTAILSRPQFVKQPANQVHYALSTWPTWRFYLLITQQITMLQQVATAGPTCRKLQEKYAVKWDALTLGVLRTRYMFMLISEINSNKTKNKSKHTCTKQNTQSKIIYSKPSPRWQNHPSGFFDNIGWNNGLLLD